MRDRIRDRSLLRPFTLYRPMERGERVFIYVNRAPFCGDFDLLNHQRLLDRTWNRSHFFLFIGETLKDFDPKKNAGLQPSPFVNSRFDTRLSYLATTA